MKGSLSPKVLALVVLCLASWCSCSSFLLRQNRHQHSSFISNIDQLERQYSFLRNNLQNDIHPGVTVSNLTTTCQVCSLEFSSRNQLFRHVRQFHGDRDNKLQESAGSTMMKQSYAFLLEYSNLCSPIQAGQIVLDELLRQQSTTRRGTNLTIAPLTIISHTQANVARMRPSLLQNNASATGDVLVVTLEQGVEDDGLQLLPQNLPKNIQIHAIKKLDASFSFHAERMCTQYIHEYLLPVQALPDSQQIVEWVTSDLVTPTPDALIQLKNALKQFVSPQVASSSDSCSKGRFGLLANKERLCWHNYVGQTLSFSPSHKHVWKAMDRIKLTNVSSSVIVIEFRGETFLPQQIQRIMGMTLAVVHGWLTVQDIQQSLNPQHIIISPNNNDWVMAPPFDYLCRCHFHFEELSNKGKSLFETDYGGPTTRVTTRDQSSVYSRIIESSDFRSPAIFLNRIRDSSSFVRDSLSEFEGSKMQINAVYALEPPPRIYEEVLKLLREIVVAQKWPVTSFARSSVIESNTSNQQGSFTVTNPKYELLFEAKHVPKGNKLFPELTRAVFELEDYLSLMHRRRISVEGVESITNEKRPLSTHCAINSNAAFTPHVDSGEGAGQSLSMIVGLGDYHHGELIVEGVKYGIRYSPLEFDGWRNRHWTNKYHGERFSLVWFTPVSK